MTFTSTVTTKGQITIPRQIREELGIVPGRQVEFFKRSGRIEIEPVKDFLEYEGFFKSKKKYSKEAARKAYIPEVLAGKI